MHLAAERCNTFCATSAALPLQDDEALFLYSIVRGLRLSSVLEIGGLRGYSALNFLQAMQPTQGKGEPGGRQCFKFAVIYAAHQRFCRCRPTLQLPF